ncbi:MAG: sulfur carrier protein ThiS [Bacteroidales bacterium]|nr:sulfur carrier protein ThiS [Bacteroidales bacterium]
MKIILNNREEVFEADTMTVSDMLEIRRFTFRMRIIKINGKLIPRDLYGSTVIHDGDNVQMFYLMSGG